VFQPSGLIASPVQEQARFLWALGQELSRTVSQIDGVLTARVQVVLPDNDLLKRDPTPSSASVFIRYDDASQVANFVSQIKMLVANSVQGLNYDKVSVVLVPVPHVDTPPIQADATTPDWQLPGLVGGGAIALMAMLALAFRRRIGSLLAGIKPPLPEPAE
jgi:type III secretion protein J